MDPERWRKIERIFHDALDADDSRRASVVEAACGGDEALRREVESLLQHQQDTGGSVFDRPAFAAPIPARRDVIGMTFAQYRVVAKIGHGGMGVVYKAEDTKLGRVVALKFLPDHRASDSGALQRFLNEARAASALNHPNICTIYDIEEHAGEQFIAMEYLEGQTIADEIAGRPLDAESIAKQGMQIAEALSAAHARGIVHRDVKPGNIIVTKSGLVKVLDFGLAKLLLADGPFGATAAMTDTGAVSGTVPYMSPEQLRGRNVDLRTDIYALGAVLYEMATGCRPFATDVLPDLIDQILNSSPVSPRRINPQVPEKLEDIILKCLEKDPEDRYQGAKEIAVDLRRMFAPSTARLSTSLTAKRRPRRARALVFAIAVVAFVVIGAWMLLRQRADRLPNGHAWVQLTDFPDSATSPALSPDGHMLAFIRGGSTFFGPGEIYLKLMPSGEPLQLTNDGISKQDPVFSRDGSRILYTTGGPPFELWSVPVTGGRPQLVMRNAGTLSWTKDGRVLFAEIREGIHMGIVSATESRSDVRQIYIPAQSSGMAHRAYASPDAKWVSIAEMDTGGPFWLPCRLVPLDGGSIGRPVGPNGPCTSAAWSPDGKWMYFSSAPDGNFHIWRQRFPNGEPEQVTFGPTQEEGIAMAPDGGSLITSVGAGQSTLWIHDQNGERQIDTEAAVGSPRFSPDASRLFFIVRKQLRGGVDAATGELWMLERQTGSRERLLPGFQVSGYDLSPDSKSVGVTAFDKEGKGSFWIAALDRHAAPRRVNWPGPVMTGAFDPTGGLFLLGRERGKAFLYHCDEDGGHPRKISNDSMNDLVEVSPSGKWLLVRTPVAGEDIPHLGLVAYPVDGGHPVLISNNLWLPGRWSADGKHFDIPFDQEGPSGATLSIAQVPLVPATGLPILPVSGVSSGKELVGVRGVKITHYNLRSNDLVGFTSGSEPVPFAYLRSVVHRNLHQVPLR
jgi:serine/threonine protein kinase/WD40 repeat protein